MRLSPSVPPPTSKASNLSQRQGAFYKLLLLPKLEPKHDLSPSRLSRLPQANQNLEKFLRIAYPKTFEHYWQEIIQTFSSHSLSPYETLQKLLKLEETYRVFFDPPISGLKEPLDEMRTSYTKAFFQQAPAQNDLFHIMQEIFLKTNQHLQKPHYAGASFFSIDPSVSYNIALHTDYEHTNDLQSSLIAHKLACLFADADALPQGGWSAHGAFSFEEGEEEALQNMHPLERCLVPADLFTKLKRALPDLLARKEPSSIRDTL